MKIIKRKLIWTDVSVKKRDMCPTYYFDFDLLNEIGLPDEEMIKMVEEMRTFAEKELKERKEEKNETKNTI